MGIYQGFERHTQMMGAYGWMGGFGGPGMLLGVLVWLAVVALLMWGISAVFTGRRADTQTEALEILKRRYAAGEISSAEFEIARRALAA
jgi:putative membrane protein